VPGSKVKAVVSFDLSEAIENQMLGVGMLTQLAARLKHRRHHYVSSGP